MHQETNIMGRLLKVNVKCSASGKEKKRTLWARSNQHPTVSDKGDTEKECQAQ